jgi:malate dehydrogenase (oxaloacetate-decarboxylating)(NADP+)
MAESDPRPSADALSAAALGYHRSPRPGKLEIKATNPLFNQRDLALAYCPGVAAACRAVEVDPRAAAPIFCSCRARTLLISHSTC